ncbi:hypothetical protein LJC63_04260 [Ruminococcaceae bacterium OttesenSCG-928-L11]|nr:hypothetical protein [Ruminococcaceae bacterium OttesenSCG-928-L11]
MSATIFCTFDQQDLADLAMGRLRNSVRGIHSIQYLADFGDSFHNRAKDRDSFFAGPAMAWGMAGGYNNASVQPSRPVSVKIVCDDAAKSQIVGRLVNLHAYKIVAS